MKRPPRLYFSFRSPYSWMSVERLRRSVPDLFTRFELVPYWDPDPDIGRALHEHGAELPYQQMSKAKHLYVLGDTKRMAGRLGLTMSWPVDLDPWWELPHLAWLEARRRGHAERCYDALVAARWSRGENICEAAVFEKVMADAGLDGPALAGAATDPATRAEGVAGLVQAWRDDVFGVPYLLLGRQRFWGVDRVEFFLDALADAGGTAGGDRGHAPAEAAGVPVGGYDRDTAGGCG